MTPLHARVGCRLSLVGARERSLAKSEAHIGTAPDFHRRAWVAGPLGMVAIKQVLAGERQFQAAAQPQADAKIRGVIAVDAQGLTGTDVAVRRIDLHPTTDSQ